MDYVLATTPSLSQQSSSNRNWWLAGGIDPDDAVAAYRPKGAGSYEASKVDLTGNGHDAYEGVAPGWTAADGWVFDGTTSSRWLGTGITPNTHDNNYSMFVRVSDVVGDGIVIGMYCDTGADGRFYIWPVNGGAYLSTAIGGASSYAKVSPTLPTGVCGFSGKSQYRNGILNGTIAAGEADCASELHIGRRNYYLDYQYLNGKIQAIVIYHTTLTVSQAAALTAAMQAL